MRGLSKAHRARALAWLGFVAGLALLGVEVFRAFRGMEYQVFWGLIALGAAILGAYEIFWAKPDTDQEPR